MLRQISSRHEEILEILDRAGRLITGKKGCFSRTEHKNDIYLTEAEKTVMAWMVSEKARAIGKHKLSGNKPGLNGKKPRGIVIWWKRTSEELSRAKKKRPRIWASAW